MMARDEIAGLIARRLDAMNRHDVSRLRDVYAEDCTVESPSGGAPVKGRAASEQIDRAWAEAFPDATFVTESVLIDGDRAAWIGRVEGAATGEFIGLPPTGKRFSVPMVFVAAFRDAQVVHERRIYDFTGMLIQLGLLRARSSVIEPPKVQTDLPLIPAPAPDLAVASRDAIVRLLSRRREAWTQADVPAITAQHASACVMDSHLAGRVEGAAAIARVYELWFGAFANSTLSDDGPVIVDGNRVAETVMMLGTDTGGFLGLPPTGKPFRLRTVWLYTVAGDRFTYVRPIYDFTGMLVQIGLLKVRPI